MQKNSVAAGFALFLTLSTQFSALAQTREPKELKTGVGKAVIMVQLVTPKPDCSSSPGPNAVPLITQKPANGNALLQIVVVDVPATGVCRARKVPAIAVIYLPKKQFEGTDTVEMEVQIEERTTRLAYRIKVASDPI